MTRMTWNQFKEHIDKILEKKGISADTEIWYIDFSFPSADEIGNDDGGMDCPSVGLDDVGISIS